MARKPKVLVIDDEKDFLASIRTLLESHNYDVIEARSGKEGLEKLVEQEPDVVMLDIMMSYIDEGYSVSQAIKFQEPYKKFSTVPIIMVSSIRESPDERFPMADTEVGMIRPDYYVTKPLDIPSFLSLLRKVTGAGAGVP